MRVNPFLLIVVFLGACTILPQFNLDKLYGVADPTRYDLPVAPTQETALEFHKDIKPILNNRCAVCHGCYDAPCQLNLASQEGLSRGANKEKVYDGTRLLAATPTRLFVDAQTTKQWRDKDFYPVLNERNQLGDLDASVLSRILALKVKESQNLNNKPLPKEQYDFSLNRAQYCPSVEEMADYEQTQPHGGMPYGLPALSTQEQTTLNEWIASGAPAKSNKALSKQHSKLVEQWETFLNKDNLKSQLMARYVYEHWFLANLYFDDVELNTPRQFFKILRSSTPPGTPIKVIATRRPFDDPQVARVYYRIKPVFDTVLFKTHMPYALNNERKTKITQWFLNDSFTVNSLPSYEPVETANPFITFAQIPANSRYEFMLHEARFTIMGFIKGAVCRGQIALNVINDHFWVVFAQPDHSSSPLVDSKQKDHLVNEMENLRLPADSGSTAGISNWLQYSIGQMDYLEAKAKYINSIFKDDVKPTLDLIWDGDGNNKNAALTIFRHFDTASVEYGFVGKNPKTMWLIDYPLLEKIHYLLVAGFDVYGNYGHQLKTRLYMDFLRIEGEYNFSAFLPKSSRKQTINEWYKGDKDTTEKYFNSPTVVLKGESGIKYETNNSYDELRQKLSGHLSAVLDKKYELENVDLPSESLKQLSVLSNVAGKSVSFLSQVSFITIENEGKENHFTLIHNNAHTNVSHLFSEDDRRVREKDTLTLAHGFIGAYPNVYMKVPLKKLGEFTERVSTLASSADYGKLLDEYGIRRTHKDFWKHSDNVLKAMQSALPIEHGLLDYNRLENQ